MNRKSKKRLSILKKSITAEDSSPTFTKLNRRISFSGKKSVKEFTSDDDKMTIWGNSYEVSADIAQHASHHTIAVDSTISHSITSTTPSAKQKSENGNKENENINLRNRTILKRKSNVLEAIRIQPVYQQKDVTPNIEAVEMDISINENESLPQKLSVSEFFSPKKIDNSHLKIIVPDNLTPVPPPKITKFNRPIEETNSKYPGRRISDELSSDSCMMATTYDASNFSIPSRILDKGDINLTYGFNLSEFDILHSKSHRPSENVTSFATKIDRINFSNDDEPKTANNSVLLQIQNPQIEQLRLTGTIVTDTDQNLNVSIEMSDSSKVLDSLRSPVKPPPKPDSPKSNPVLEMFKIRNQLKKQMAKQFEEKLEKEYLIPFIPAKFEPPITKYLDSMNLTNAELEITKIKENTKRQTILFAKDSSDFNMSVEDALRSTSQNAEVETNIVVSDNGQKSKRATIQFQNDVLDTSIVCQKDSTENINNARKTIHFLNQELEISKLNTSIENPIKEKKSKTEGSNQIKKKLVDREPFYSQNNDLDLTGSFELQIKKIENISRGTIHFPNQEIDISMVDEVVNKGEKSTAEPKPGVKKEAKIKRDTVHFLDQQLEMSIEASNSNVRNVSGKPGRQAAFKRETIHFQNNELDMSLDSSNPNMENENKNMDLTERASVKEKYKPEIKRGTIYFQNELLETSKLVNSSNKNINLIVSSNVCEQFEGESSRDTTHFVNEQLEISGTELSPNMSIIEETKENEFQKKRETIHFLNQELKLSTIELCNDKEDRNQNISRQTILHEKDERQNKRDTTHFPNHALEMSTMDPILNVDSNNRNEKLIRMTKVNEGTKVQTKQESIERNRSLKRGTIHFPSQELDISAMESDVTIKNNIKNKNLSEPVKTCLELSTVESDNVKSENRNSIKQKDRRTIHFLNQALETSMDSGTNQNLNISTVESYPITSANRNLNLMVQTGINEKNERRPKRTTHFSNQELEMSTLEAALNIQSDTKNEKLLKTAKVKEPHKAQTKQETIQENRNLRRITNRGTIHFPNQELEISMMESDLNVKGDFQIINSSNLVKIGEGHNPTTKINYTKRDTLHFPNEKLDISAVELTSDIIIRENRYLNLTKAIVDEKNEKPTKRGTIHFPNQELESSVFVEPENKNQYLLDASKVYKEQELDISPIEPTLNIKSNSKIEKIREKVKVSAEQKVKNKDTIEETGNLKRNTKRETIHFPNQELDISLIDYNNIYFSDTAKNREEHEQSHTKRATLHFLNQQLDLSTVESSNVNRNSINGATKNEEPDTKRRTIHFPNQELETSMMESCPYVNISNIKLPDQTKTREEYKAHTNRVTSYFPNQQLEMSIESYPDTLNEKRNLDLAGEIIADEKVERQSNRGTIYFKNHELESSVIVEADNKTQCLLDASKLYKEQVSRSNNDNMYLLNEQLDISTVESNPNKKIADRQLNLTREDKIIEKYEMPTKRGTIYFSNQELETSVINSNLEISSDEVNINRKPNLEKFVRDFQDNNRLDPITLANHQNKIQPGIFENDLIAAISVNERNQVCVPMETSIKRNTANRGTIYFPNEELDTSIVEDNQVETNKYNRRTNENHIIDVSMEEIMLDDPIRYSQCKTIHFQNNVLDITETNPRTPAYQLHKTDLENIEPKSLRPGTTYYQDKTLDISEFVNKNHNTISHIDDDLNMSETEQKTELMKQPSQSTIDFPNQGIDTYTTEEADQMDTSANQSIKNVPIRAKSQLRGTIHYKSDNLDISFENQRNKTGIDPKLIHRDIKAIDTTKEALKIYETNRQTIHYQNQDLETTLPLDNENSCGSINFQNQNSEKGQQNFEKDPLQIDWPEIKSTEKKPRETIHFVGTDLGELDISDQLVSGDTRSIAYCENIETKTGTSRAKRNSAINSCNNSDRASINCPNINLDYNDKTNANVEDLNMSNDFDEKHIKQQSTMTMAHIVKFLSEKRKNGEQQEMSDINLDNVEIDLSSYQKHEEQLVNNLSGLKLYGQDSTYFENNTQALCNLDPKRIFCVSKYDAMNAATNQRSLLPVSIKKSVTTSGMPNISTHQLQGENTLHDIVPRFGKENVQNNIQDLLEITANLAQQNKTRQEICNDYINLTISRFSSSFANSSNTEQIDQTNIKLVNSFGDMEEDEHIVSKPELKYMAIEEADQVYQNVDKIFTRKRTTQVPVLDLTDCHELLNQPSFTDIANAYKLKNLKNLKRVSGLQEPFAGPEKPSLRFLMNNYREQLMVEKSSIEVGIIPFLPLIPKITVLLQNKLAERSNYWTCHDTYYNHGILMFTHHRVPCVQIKMLFELFEENEFGDLEFTSVIPMMSKTKIISSTFELIQHLQFFKRVPSEMKNACRRSNEILNFLDNLDSKIIKKNYEDIQKLKDIVVSTNSKIWHKNETGECGITKSLIHCRNIYDIVIKISDLQITDISDVTVKPHILPTNKVTGLSRGLDFLRELLEKPRDYFNFYE